MLANVVRYAAIEAAAEEELVDMASVVLLLSICDCDGEDWVADVTESASEEGETGLSPVGEISALALEEVDMAGATVLLPLLLTNGSPSSWPGVGTGVGRPVGPLILFLFACRLLELVGDARRERVFMKILFFLGGMDSGAMGKGGNLTCVPCEWRNFTSSSTISTAVRVRVRL